MLFTKYYIVVIIVTGAPPEYPGGKHEAPIDMRLRSRPAPPPYTRPSVITKSNDTPPGKELKTVVNDL